MKYLHTMVRVENIEDSLDFYCNKLGLKEIRRRDDEKGKYTLIFLGAENSDERHALLELTYNWDPEKYTGGRNFGHLAFAVDHIYDTCQRLQEAGIRIDPGDLDRFFRTAIAGREYGKFEFTRYLSHALDALVEFGAVNGVDREDLSHCQINDLLPQSADGISQAPPLESILYSSGEGQRIYKESTRYNKIKNIITAS